MKYELLLQPVRKYIASFRWCRISLLIQSGLYELFYAFILSRQNTNRWKEVKRKSKSTYGPTGHFSCYNSENHFFNILSQTS